MSSRKEKDVVFQPRLGENLSLQRIGALLPKVVGSSTDLAWFAASLQVVMLQQWRTKVGRNQGEARWVGSWAELNEPNFLLLGLRLEQF